MQLMNIDTINASNRQDAASFIRHCEIEYQKKMENISEYLRMECEEKPVALLSGPSGSAKTSTAQRIGKLLNEHGHETHTLSMDNYFYPYTAGPLPVDENGSLDLEAPRRLDCTLLSEHLKKIARCEQVEVPIFDFATQSRAGSTPLHRKKGQLVILEGIHALNPEVTGECGDIATCIYVSVRTRVSDGNGRVLHPEKIRLMRRLIRDKLFRGRDIDETLSLFGSVQRGEDRYIMPYKRRAKIEIDTFIPYELSVCRDILLPDLSIAGDTLAGHYADIRHFLSLVAPLPAAQVPQDSILREFIGESREG